MQVGDALDPTDVGVSQTSKSQETGETNTSERLMAEDEDQYGPSTSTGAGYRRRQLVSSASTSEALRRPRKSLPFLPRTTQYERHPLLQMRSTATGLSEFELLMLERDADDRPRRMSVETAGSSPNAGRTGGRPALVPRTTQREIHPLFVRSADSGVCELEEYLKEISQTTPPARKGSATGSASVGQERSSVSSQPVVASSGDCERKATTTAVRKLEPRTSQWERHALLEIKDESGLSELERLLMEKDKEATEATDGRRCTVCGADAATRCDCAKQTNRHSLDVDYSSPSAPSVVASSDLPTSAQQKRVRFMHQRQKTEPEDLTAAQSERTVGDTDAAAPATKANSVDVPPSVATKKSSKSRSSKSRGIGARADSTPASVGTGTHRKSCCVS